MRNKLIIEAAFRMSNLDDRALMLWRYADFVLAAKHDGLMWSLYAMEGVLIELAYSNHHDRIEKIEIATDTGSLDKYLVEIPLETILNRNW